MLKLCGFAVSNYYNKLKLVLLEKGVPFEERLVYPWQRELFHGASPMGKIPSSKPSTVGSPNPR
jgi:glutathione S-transferase